MIDGWRTHISFKSRNQLPLILVWQDLVIDGETINGRVLFNSMKLETGRH